MRIASTATPPAPATDIVRIRRDDPAPTSAPSPVAKFISKYRETFFELPGMVTAEFRSVDRDVITFNFRTEADREIGAMVLSDAVDGVRILTAVDETSGGSRLPDTSLGKHQAAIAAVNALPGVWRSLNFPGDWDGNGTAVFSTVDQFFADRLDPLIRDQIAGQRRDDGSVRMYDVVWRADLPT